MFVFSPKTDKIYDRCNAEIKLYPDVYEMIPKLKKLGYKIATASRTHCTEEALSLLHLFNLYPLMSSVQIYPGQKITHFKKIVKDTGDDWSEMVFFDDESRNIRDLTPYGVHCVLVRNKLDWNTLRQGLQGFVQRDRK